MAAVFRKLFCSSVKLGGESPEKNVKGGVGVGGGVGGGGEGRIGVVGVSGSSSSGSKNESPARRLLRHGLHRDHVQPADVPTNSPINAKKYVRFFKFKKNNTNSNVKSGQDMGEGKQSVGNNGGGHQLKVRAKRLMKELKDVQKLQQLNSFDPVFTVELVNDNLFEWHVQLYKLDVESELAADMKELGIKSILFHVIFPENFPFAPPFIRVITPKIDKGFV
ncbi:ubiquitin-conjugating enzyme E2 q, putative [Pediculus humanus corporis]|uniref:Ubiquitin-conjugating enzyme E2 q, putative n=1 Tax=Pediculus humanus subsp. corporis TaxID=121224 RepID=E0VU23_PEDHC|nr:ubiquitin-conjugating enzyme E2 q, putative [Pediculus humanus corporis]EEB16879.1 ubiquitin-conjugating enzyme E2 q, putative [Pediculus humanus corporis]